MIDKNPYVQPYNHFSGYQDSIEKLKERPEAVEFERLCFNIFSLSDDGVRLMELIKERYLIPALIDIGNPNYATANTWAEGYKQAFRNIMLAVETHSQRKVLETNI